MGDGAEYHSRTGFGFEDREWSRGWGQLALRLETADRDLLWLVFLRTYITLAIVTWTNGRYIVVVQA